MRTRRDWIVLAAAAVAGVLVGCLDTSGLAFPTDGTDVAADWPTDVAAPDLVEDLEDVVDQDASETTGDDAVDEPGSEAADVVHDEATPPEDVPEEDSDVDLDGAGDVASTCGGPWSGSDSTRVCYGFPVVAGRTYTASSCDPWSPATEVWMEGDCACVPDRDVCGSHGCTCTATETGSAMACAGCRGALPCEWVVRIDGDCTAP